MQPFSVFSIIFHKNFSLTFHLYFTSSSFWVVLSFLLVCLLLQLLTLAHFLTFVDDELALRRYPSQYFLQFLFYGRLFPWISILTQTFSSQWNIYQGLSCNPTRNPFPRIPASINFHKSKIFCFLLCKNGVTSATLLL